MMRSRVNLVVILLTLSCVVQVLEAARSGDKRAGHKEHSLGKKILKEPQNKIAVQSSIVLRGDEKTKTLRTQTKNNALLSKDYSDGGDRPRRKKRKMDRTMMALLMAYKMKFVALIPTMVGGLILLKATALLAGFFFALFAAVLGLKNSRDRLDVIEHSVHAIDETADT